MDIIAVISFLIGSAVGILLYRLVAIPKIRAELTKQVQSNMSYLVDSAKENAKRIIQEAKEKTKE